MVMAGKILDQLRDCQLMKDFTPCNEILSYIQHFLAKHNCFLCFISYALVLELQASCYCTVSSIGFMINQVYVGLLTSLRLKVKAISYGMRPFFLFQQNITVWWECCQQFKESFTGLVWRLARWDKYTTRCFSSVSISMASWGLLSPR
jgi:hypothetical protein